MDELKIRKFSGAVVWPEGGEGMSSAAVYVDGKVLPDTQISPCLCRNINRSVDDPRIVDDGASALFLGAFYGCWGHSLTDSLRFLWVFLPHYANRLGVDLSSLKLVYVPVGGKKNLGKSFRELLMAVGVPINRIIEVTQPTRFKLLYVPEASFYEDLKTIERHWTKEYSDSIERVIATVVPKALHPTRMIYFSRTKWQKGLRRKDFGEVAIEKAIRKNLPECEIISPEQFSFGEQVSMLQSCKKLIVTEGSLSHNALFLPQRAELVILRKCWLANRYQKAINEMRELKVIELDASWKNRLINPLKNPCAGPFFLAVTTDLARYLHISKGKVSLSERFLYEIVTFRYTRFVRGLKSFIKKVLKR